MAHGIYHEIEILGYVMSDFGFFRQNEMIMVLCRYNFTKQCMQRMYVENHRSKHINCFVKF